MEGGPVSDKTGGVSVASESDLGFSLHGIGKGSGPSTSGLRNRTGTR